MKQCSKCKEIKSINEYYKNKNRLDGLESQCKDCKKGNSKKRYSENTELIKSQMEKSRRDKGMKERTSMTDEERKEKARQYREDNKEMLREANRQYYQSHRERRIVEIMKYQKSEQGKLSKRKADAKYRQSDKGQECMFRGRMKRRSYKHKVIFTPYQRMQLLDRDNWKCQCCGTWVHDARVGDWNNEHKAHIDHIVPISKGGDSTIDNLQVLCRTCNLTKGNKITA